MKIYSEYLGIKNLDLRTPGNTWGDNILIYKGFEFAQWMIEDALRHDYSYELENTWNVDDISLNQYIQDHIESYLDDCVYGLGYFDIEWLKENAPTWFEYLGDTLLYSDNWDYGNGYPSDKAIINHYSGISFTAGDFIS